MIQSPTHLIILNSNWFLASSGNALDSWILVYRMYIILQPSWKTLPNPIQRAMFTVIQIHLGSFYNVWEFHLPNAELSGTYFYIMLSRITLWECFHNILLFQVIPIVSPIVLCCYRQYEWFVLHIRLLLDSGNLGLNF